MSKNDPLSPEMLKIIKIFGIGSLTFVLILSFFNEKRANNSGTVVSVLSISDAERLYFKNIRGLYYDLESRDDAKMSVYRYGKRIREADHPLFNLSILVNRVKDEAYIYIEPWSELNSFSLRATVENQTDTLEYISGDKFVHFCFVEKLYPFLLKNTYFETLIDEVWIPILVDEKERDALRITIKDYYRLINKPE